MIAHLSLNGFCMSRFICLNLPQTKRNLVNKPVSFWFLVVLLKVEFDFSFLVYLLKFPCRDLTSNSECCSQ